MNSTTTLPSQTAARDQDLAEQARPGHGVPSQDPNPAAQIPLGPGEAEREAKSVMTGGAMVGGAAIGATIGVAVGGPVGVVVGGTVGAVAGALGGAAAGTAMSPADPSNADPVLEDGTPAYKGGQHAIAGDVKP
jgi:ABC-type dipeptide/oligopeptide/nickel transport system permease subunit